MTKGQELVANYAKSAGIKDFGWEESGLAEAIDRELALTGAYRAEDLSPRPKIAVLDISGPSVTVGWVQSALNDDYALGYRLIATAGEANHLLILENQETP